MKTHGNEYANAGRDNKIRRKGGQGMSEWKTIPADEYCDSVRDGTHDTPKPTQSGFKLVTGKHLKKGVIDPSDAYFISESDYNKINERSKVDQWDVLMSMIGTIGEIAVVKDKPNYAIKNIALFKCGGSEIKGKWLACYLSSPIAKGYFSGNQKGSSQQFLSLNQLRNLPILVADESYMKYVVEILSRYDALIENYQKQIKLLEEAAQRLYKEWFVELRFPGHENTKMVDGLPEGWERKKLVDFAKVTMGQSPKSEFYNNERNGLPFHQGVGSYGNRFVVDETYSTSYTRIAEPNSVLFSVRAPVGRLNITKNKIVIGRGLAAMNHMDGCQSFLFYLLKERFFKDNIIGNGAIFASISKDELLNLEFMIPTEKLTQKFNEIAGNFDKAIMKADNQIRLLTEARDRLLPKVMGGEMESYIL